MARVLAAPGQQAQHLDRLLETATAGMGVATGEEWALFALVATRLPTQAKASPGARFLAALGHDLPGRLAMLEPAQLVGCRRRLVPSVDHGMTHHKNNNTQARIVNGWPRGGLDDWERHVIQAVVEACIDRLAAFKPSELAQLVKGLCRPVTVRSGQIARCVGESYFNSTKSTTHTKNKGDAAGGAPRARPPGGGDARPQRAGAAPEGRDQSAQPARHRAGAPGLGRLCPRLRQRDEPARLCVAQRSSSTCFRLSALNRQKRTHTR